MKVPIEEPVRCIYCGLWVDLEDGKNLVRMDADGWLMAAHPPCLKQHRPDAQIDGAEIGTWHEQFDGSGAR